MIIEYDRSPRISPEQRIQSLADSVMRAFEELESGKNITEPKPITLEDLGAYPKTGGIIDGDVSVRGNKVTLFGEAKDEGFIVEGSKPSSFTGNMFVAIDEETKSLCEQTLGADILDYMYPNGEIPEIATDEGIKYLIDCMYPVGRILETTNVDDNPNVCYPWQTWERYGNGRVTVGVDENDDAFVSAGLELGEKGHILTVDEMPEHSHTIPAYNRGYEYKSDGYWSVNGPTYKGVIGSSTSGKNVAHNNIQPSVTVYRWRRTG